MADVVVFDFNHELVTHETGIVKTHRDFVRYTKRLDGRFQ